jgi:hypothetical protein
MLRMTVPGLRTLRHKRRGPVGLKVGRRVLWTQESVDRYLGQLQADADRDREAINPEFAAAGSPSVEQKMAH